VRACGHLQRVTGKPVIKGLIHRGGLRAQILSAGMIHADDPFSEGVANTANNQSTSERVPAGTER
jgi:hypothetical protein